MERYICIRSRFCQPLRENPWLEAIELRNSPALVVTGAKEAWIGFRDSRERWAFAYFFSFEVNPWAAQNIYFEVTKANAPRFRERTKAGARELWLATDASLGEQLYVNSSRIDVKAQV